MRIMARAKILVVEDNPDNRELIVMFLRRQNYEIIEATTAAEALHEASTRYPDIILMDLGLPGMNGDEVTARIKADPSTAHVPIVVNTAFDPSASIVTRAVAAGADEIMYKPTNFRNLLEVTQRLLGRGPSFAVA
jgi:CheY-like chemotaxis protein